MCPEKQFEEIQQFATNLRNVSAKVSAIIMEETHEFLSGNHKYNSLKDFHEAHPKGRNLMEAEFLTELGYRKSSEVAREIFEEIEEIIDKHYNRHIFGVEDLSDVEQEAVMNFSGDVTYDISELKKKYTESENLNGKTE